MSVSETNDPLSTRSFFSPILQKQKVGGRKSSRSFKNQLQLPHSASSACLTPRRHHQVLSVLFPTSRRPSFANHEEKAALFQLFLLFVTAVKLPFPILLLLHLFPPLHRRFPLLCPRCITAPSPSNGFPMLRPSCRSRGRSIPFPASVARTSCLDMHEPPVGVIVLIPSLLTPTQSKQERTGRPPQTPPT